MTHRDDVPWWEAPIPRRWHTCWPQTDGWLGLTQVWRCACGAICHPVPGRRQYWMEKNARRKNR